MPPRRGRPNRRPRDAVTDSKIVIIRKRARSAHAARHGGAWKVAYADFVTAMMAFFLVMWLVAQNSATKASIAGYFTDPGVFSEQARQGVLPGSRSGVEAVIAPAESLDALQEAMGRLEQSLGGLPEFARLADQIDIQLTAEGLRIELLEGEQPAFFATGSAALAPAAQQVLGVIARELGGLSHPVIVEGHTDSRPYAGLAAYTNWELSVDRANAARRAMEVLGLHPGQVEAIRGYADRLLRVASEPFDPRNRRVSIVVPLKEQIAAASAVGEFPPVLP